MMFTTNFENKYVLCPLVNYDETLRLYTLGLNISILYSFNCVIMLKNDENCVQKPVHSGCCPQHGAD